MGYRGIIEFHYSEDIYVSEEEKMNVLLSEYIIKELKLLKREDIFLKLEDSNKNPELGGPLLNAEIELSKTHCAYLLDKLRKRTISEIHEIMNQEFSSDLKEKITDEMQKKFMEESLFDNLCSYFEHSFPTIKRLMYSLHFAIENMNKSDSDKKAILKIMCG